MTRGKRMYCWVSCRKNQPLTQSQQSPPATRQGKRNQRGFCPTDEHQPEGEGKLRRGRSKAWKKKRKASPGIEKILNHSSKALVSRGKGQLRKRQTRRKNTKLTVKVPSTQFKTQGQPPVGETWERVGNAAWAEKNKKSEAGGR